MGKSRVDLNLQHEFTLDVKIPAAYNNMYVRSPRGDMDVFFHDLFVFCVTILIKCAPLNLFSCESRKPKQSQSVKYRPGIMIETTFFLT